MSKGKKNKIIIEEPVIAKGFDRDIDYQTMRDKLIEEYNIQLAKLENIDEDKKPQKSKKRLTINKIIYLIIAMTQLRNGSRISEACNALRLFINKNNTNKRVTVKIAKSESTKYTRDTKEQYKTKIRYRQIEFPNKWIDSDIVDTIRESHKDFITDERLRKRVLDYLLLNFDCNTHSLRYAFINYMLYDLKKEMTLIAKFVGHVDVNQLVRYTQQKNTEQLFDLDI